MAEQRHRLRHHFQYWISRHRWASIILASFVYAILVGFIPAWHQGKTPTQILLAMGSWGALGLLIFGLLFRPRVSAHSKGEPRPAAKRSQKSRGSKKSRRNSRGSRRH
jgi:hypothetical protein